MPVHPIAVVERVIEEYKHHVATEFRARDEKLREELRTALEKDGFLAGPAFFQAYRPFKDGLWCRLVSPLPSPEPKVAGSNLAWRAGIS